jgi:hypothetical protein
MPVFRHRAKHAPLETKRDREERKLQEHLGKRAVALDYSAEFQDGARTLCGWGKLAARHAFTRYAAETIQEVLWVAKQKYDNQGVFLTGTVPAVTVQATRVMMEWSSWIMNRVKQLFRDHVNGEATVVSVWEMTQAGRPHVHIALISNKHESLLKTLVNWHDWWFGILRDLTVMTGVNLFSRSLYSSGEKSLMSWYPFSESTQADAQIISKDVSRYLSKYVSKGARSESTSTIYHPASWWGVDRETRREARRERVRLSIGGYPLELIQSAYARAKTMLRDCSDAIFAFANPYFQAYGGEVAFIPDGKELSLLAGFVDYLSQNGLEYCLTTNI